MPTQITNKQVKIIDTVNFNNQAIENAIIDGSKNTINNLDITKNLVDAGITKITSSDTMIELAQEIENKHFSIGTTLFGKIKNTGMPFQGNAEVRVDILDEKDDDQVILFTLYSTNVEPYEWEWRYYLSNTVVWIAKALPNNDYTSNSQNTVPTSYALKTGLDTKQDVLVSGTNIKTINNNSILGNGNLEITVETNEIITLPTTSTTVTLSSNNIYKLNVDDFGPSPTITINLATPQNLNIDNSILLYLGGVHLGSTFNWGTTHFFNDETPTIEHNGCYDVHYIWNPFSQVWVCKVVLSINYDNM